MKTFTYCADCGSVRIGNANFSATFNNGYGDGVFEIDVIEKNEKDTCGLPLVGTAKGTFNVYGSDCSTNEILTTLTGRYFVFAKQGHIVFEKWGD